MTWQAVSGMHYSMIGDGGPAGILVRTGKQRHGATAISDASVPFGNSTAVKAKTITAVHLALRQWG